MRLWPSSLLGQTLATVAAALLLAQIVTSVLLLRVAEERREEGLLTAAEVTLWGAPMFRMDRGDGILADERRTAGQSRRELPARLLRGEVTGKYPLLPGEANNPEWAARIDQRMEAIIEKPQAVLVTSRMGSEDPVVKQRAREWNRGSRRKARGTERLLVVAVQWEKGGPWHVARIPYPRTGRAVLFVTAAQTSSIFVILMVVLFFLLRRITRPLARLADRTAQFAQSRVAEKPLEVRGPADTRRLIAAHNAMEARILALLDEKDVMLGAIGHDLKTPLAALRVRTESVPDEDQRTKMTESIEDITATLDDILALARMGSAGKLEAENVNLAALAIGVVEEFEDLGEQVTIDDPARLIAKVQVTWIKRALRNLVSNALRYGETAHVSVLSETDEAIVRIDDTGPGIPEGQMSAMLEPFTRGEGSRNRATGGAGLGLTLARAIAEHHGGRMVLANRESGGLRAEIRLPVSA